MRPGLVVAALTVLWAQAARAQVTWRADLEFGTVISGVSTNVAPTSSAAASWRIHYTLLAIASSMQLTLPATLSRVGGGGSLPVSYCSTCAVYRANNTNPSGGATFNPANQVSFGLLTLGTNIYVWLGGSVSPPLNQPPGAYTGTVVLTLYGIVL